MRNKFKTKETAFGILQFSEINAHLFATLSMAKSMGIFVKRDDI